MFIDKLISQIKQKNNPTVLGLDPKVENIPEFIKKKAYSQFGRTLHGAAHAVWLFNKEIIDSLYDIIPAVKPQLAYYEMYGVYGLQAFLDTVSYSKKKGLLVIADGKRNDIGSTVQAYSSAYLGRTFVDTIESVPVFDTDALTVNAYLGFDGIEPFLQDCSKYDKGIFVLVKTSNKSSGQLQDIDTKDGKKNYEIMAELVNEWGISLVGKSGYSSVGAVVGATYPEELKYLRKVMKKSYLLVPGYGTQGGTAEGVVNAFNSDGLGALINASRSILYAYKSETWKEKYKPEQCFEASRAEAVRMRDDIMRYVGNIK